MTIRSRMFAALIAPFLPCFPLWPLSPLAPAALAAPAPTGVALVADEQEDWELEVQLEPELELIAPSDEEIDRLVREGGILRVEIDGQLYEEAIAPPPGKALGQAELAALEANLLHQERLLAILERGERDPEAARTELLAYTLAHRDELSATTRVREAIERRVFHDHAALLSFPAEWLSRFISTFERSAAILMRDRAWEDDLQVREALVLFTGTTP